MGLAKLKSSLFRFAYYVAEKYDMAHSSSRQGHVGKRDAEDEKNPTLL